MVIAAIVDISARKALEDQARETNAELERRVKERTAELERSNRDKQGMLDCLERARLELERLSRQDSLTGLANRREFEARVALEQQRSERNDSPMCLAMLDLDHFKQVNDCFGHALGDEVLRRIGTILRNQCRTIDAVSRHGGEEFALALPDTDRAEAIATCERIRRAVEAYSWRDLHPQLRLTISIGVTRRMRGEEATHALGRADRLLYDAKRMGRNRVESEPAP
jgi:diguanylate cyclase (GGDEF)-like protein